MKINSMGPSAKGCKRNLKYSWSRASGIFMGR